jgi:hypothetical protein
MKLLIIAGPYEADRIRKSAVAAGFEAVAVEPGESLSGWITATRPQLIVMAPQMVNPDPALALAKVRSVPRGRVPIFLVGDEADEVHMAALSEGFFVRPVSPDELLDHARAVLNAERARESTFLGHEFSHSGKTPKPGKPSASGKQGMTLRPLVTAESVKAPPAGSARSVGDANLMLAELGAGIDALLDAELTDAIAVAPTADGHRDFGGEPTAKMRAGDVAKAREASEDTNPDGARARILARHAIVEAGDYFQVLGISRGASSDDVRLAHEKIARELRPEAMDPAVARDLGTEIEAIRSVTAEALRILTDDRLRPRYLQKLA